MYLLISAFSCCIWLTDCFCFCVAEGEEEEDEDGEEEDFDEEEEDEEDEEEVEGEEDDDEVSGEDEVKKKIHILNYLCIFPFLFLISLILFYQGGRIWSGWRS